MADADTPVDDGLVAAVAAELDDADTDEAAAIAVAIGAHLSDRRRAAATAAEDAELDWNSRRWVFSGRMARSSGRFVEVADDAPSDPWAAAGRADRM